jgi:hypothetical protein
LSAVLPEWSVPPAAALFALFPASLESDARAQQFVDFLAANIVPALALPVRAKGRAASAARSHDAAAP